MNIVILHADLNKLNGISKQLIANIKADMEGMKATLEASNHTCVITSENVIELGKKDSLVIYYMIDALRANTDVDFGNTTDDIKNNESIILNSIDILKQAKGRVAIRYFDGPFEIIDMVNKTIPGAYWMPVSDFAKRDLWMIPDDRNIVCSPFTMIESIGQVKPDLSLLSKIRNDKNVNLLFVCRKFEDKYIYFMIEALRKYVASNDGNVCLHILDYYGDVSLSKDQEKYIWQCGLKGNIDIVRTDKPSVLNAYYQGCDAMLCISDERTFSYNIAMAQYQKLPVIALRYNALYDTAGKEQVLLAFDDKDWAAAIKVVAKSPENMSYLSEAGSKNFEERFTLTKVRKNFEDVIKNIIATPVEDMVKPAEVKQGMDKFSGRITFVIPWFGEKVPGGAEMEVRMTARRFREAGIDIEILSTRVREFTADWNEDFYPEGTEYIWDVPVTRFNVRKRDTAAFDAINIHLMHHEMISEKDADIFCKEMVNSPALYKFIREQKDRYDMFLFIPYMFGTTYYGIQECYEKAVMLPCFHDEAYAYLPNFIREYSKIAGFVYHAAPERVLADRIYNLENCEEFVMGIGMDTDITYDAKRFRDKFKIEDDFIIYAGRKDMGKGVDLLIDYFCKYLEETKSSMKLILIGGGSIDIPSAHKEDVIDLGFVDMQDKYDACTAALCLAQLSPNESFSFVIMESWLCHRPVIVNKQCAVTTNFAESFEGGRAIDGYKEFADAVNFYLTNPEEASKMADSGCKHVKEAFDWEKIIANFRVFFDKIRARQISK